jgi:fructose-bisphosphate aldolase class II
MPLVTDYQEVKDTYREAAELGVALPALCAEDRETVEAILAAAAEVGRKIGVPHLPVIVSWTGRYPPRPQATFVAACGDPMLGSRLVLSDLEVFASEGSPYADLRIMPHLDHAWPWLDPDLLEGLVDRLASVMCDASLRPFDENIALTAKYVEQVRGRVLVEGAVDELPESGEAEPAMALTTVEQARRFVAETGVDMIVPNVGTEHRATADQVAYRGDRAREISEAVGPVLCLHGASSLKEADYGRIAGDGIVKVNIFTTLAMSGGVAVTQYVLENLTGALPADDLRALVERGVLGPAVLEGLARGEGRRLAAAVNAGRRDAWFECLKGRCVAIMEQFGYGRYAG